MTMRKALAGFFRNPAAATLVLAAQLLCARPSCADAPVWLVPGGDLQKGKVLIERFGCASCHAIPGVRGSRGNVGPPLDHIGSRTFVAGMLRNNPANLVRWIRFPQGVVPGNAMPDMGVTEEQARDIAAYLYTLH
jgi:cytochrome c2